MPFPGCDVTWELIQNYNFLSLNFKMATMQNETDYFEQINAIIIAPCKVL